VALDAAGLREWAMSQENVEIIRRAFKAYERGDLAAMLRDAHPESRSPIGKTQTERRTMGRRG
jgi:ketosteroid isomerase-like protein